MLSVSMLSCYLYCQRKLFLQYVLRLSEPPKEALVLGTIRHKIFERINDIDEKIVRSISESDSHDEIFKRYEKEYIEIIVEVIKKKKKDISQFNLTEEDVFSKMKDSVVREAEERTGNVCSFIKKNHVFGDELWEKLTPKIISEFDVASEKLGLRGIIDRIEMYDDLMVPVELKTGKCPDEGGWPSHELQLYSYMTLLNGKQRKVEEGRLVYLDANKTIKLSNNPFVEEDVKRMILKTNQVIHSDTPPPFELNINKCNACGLKNQCYDKELIIKRVSRLRGS